MTYPFTQRRSLCCESGQGDIDSSVKGSVIWDTAFISFDCYSDTTVLINKFGIRDEEKSNEVEGVITSARYTKWLSAPEVRDFDFAYYKEIHRFLLSVKEVAGFNERF